MFDSRHIAAVDELVVVVVCGQLKHLPYACKRRRRRRGGRRRRRSEESEDHTGEGSEERSGSTTDTRSPEATEEDAASDKVAVVAETPKPRVGVTAVEKKTPVISVVETTPVDIKSKPRKRSLYGGRHQRRGPGQSTPSDR